MDQNRDGFIDKNDLRDTFAALGGSPTASVHHCSSQGCTQAHILYTSLNIKEKHNIQTWRHVDEFILMQVSRSGGVLGVMYNV